MGQTTVVLDPVIGLAGQLEDCGFNQIVSYVAAEAIPFGTLVELSSTAGKVQRPQGTNLAAIAGVALYVDMKEPGGFAAGDVVPVLRKGRVFANWNGTTQGNLVAPNVMHSTTTVTYRGYLTDAATSTTTGVEIAAAPAGTVLVRDTGLGASGVCLVELNLP